MSALQPKKAKTRNLATRKDTGSLSFKEVALHFPLVRTGQSHLSHFTYRNLESQLLPMKWATAA
jgi:hypothetical protein